MNNTNYTLTRVEKGSKWLYEVKDSNGQTVATRTSTRDYVAATANGEFFFGRMDLIGKGQHGRILGKFEDYYANPQRAYMKIVNTFVPSYRKKYMQEFPYEEYVKRMDSRKDRYVVLSTIAYLQR